MQNRCSYVTSIVVLTLKVLQVDAWLSLVGLNHAEKASSCLGPAETQRPLTSRNDKAVDQEITICHYAKVTIKLDISFFHLAFKGVLVPV